MSDDDIDAGDALALLHAGNFESSDDEPIDLALDCLVAPATQPIFEQRSDALPLHMRDRKEVATLKRENATLKEEKAELMDN